MKRIITSSLCLALACTFVAKTAAQGSPMQPFDPQAASQTTAATSLPEALKVKTFTLSNGMTVWINEDHSQPKVFGAVVVNAGAKDCPETGIAHYFEHMMFKGTEKIGTIDYEAEKPYLDSIAVKYDELAATTDDEERQAIQMEINRLNIAASDYAIPNEFNNLITECGGSGLNAYTSMDVTVYHNEFVSSYL
ncbi:MAG: insulinase family protein, partial [Bacteroidia bacterium]|nr:insulinase family protein [Bacteroidia bacterium]